jgi:SAM-dependent methyltransferase
VVQHDRWADVYDAVHCDAPVAIDDVPFYVEEAVRSGGPVLELACGTGRVAIPIARAGIDVVGLDESPRMLEVAKRRAEAAGLPEERLRLVQGDMRDFDVGQRFPLVIIPFRSFLHMEMVEDQKRCLGNIAEHLAGGGRLILNMFVPKLELIVEDWTTLHFWKEFSHPQTGRRVLLWETRTYDTHSQQISNRFLFHELDEDGTVVSQCYRTLSLRYMWRYEGQHLFEGCGYEVEALYGWFDRRPFDEKSEEMVWVLRRSRS